MAYMSQQNKRSLTPAIQSILRKYGLKATLAVRHHSTLVLNIKSGPIDFVGNFNRMVEADRNNRSTVLDGHLQVNEYWFHEHFTGQAKACLAELIEAMNVGNHDNSDAQVDFFDVGWYTHINIGKWNQPYTYNPKG